MKGYWSGHPADDLPKNFQRQLLIFRRPEEEAERLVGLLSSFVEGSVGFPSGFYKDPLQGLPKVRLATRVLRPRCHAFRVQGLDVTQVHEFVIQGLLHKLPGSG